MEIDSITNFDFTSLGTLKFSTYKVEQNYNNALVEVRLYFDNKALFICVDNDTDTIKLTIQEYKKKILNNNDAHRDIKRLFDSLKSRTLLWVWALVNEQGYKDGLQFEFIDRKYKEENTIIVQFIAISSTIRINEVKKVYPQYTPL